jgi:hypothetical protein
MVLFFNGFTMSYCGHIGCNNVAIDNIQFSETSSTKERVELNNRNISLLYDTYIDSSKTFFSDGKRKDLISIGGCTQHFATLLALINSKKAKKD